MKKYILGQDFYEKVKDVLNLPKNVKRFRIYCDVNDVVTVECEYYEEADVEKLVSLFKRFELVEK